LLKNATVMRAVRVKKGCRMIKTGVGGTGTVISRLGLFLLSRGAGLRPAAATVLAAGLASASNYLLIDSGTFCAGDRAAPCGV
jgi:putative flippase GtrA